MNNHETDPKNLNIEISKNTIKDIAEFIACISNQKESSKTTRNKWSIISAFLVPIVTVFTVFLSLGVKGHWEYKQQLNLNNQERINLIYKQIQNTNKKIQALYQVRNKLMVSMGKMRAAWFYGNMHCAMLEKLPASRAKFKNTLYSKDFTLTSLQLSSTGILDNSTEKLILKFLGKVDLSQHAVCSKSSTKDSVLRKIEVNTNLRILAHINHLKQKKLLLKDKTIEL